MRNIKALNSLRLFRKIKRLMKEGVLQSDVAATYPLDEIAAAVKQADAPGKGGKVLLRIGQR